MSAAPAVSARYAGVSVPGMGTTCRPWASTHASATRAGLPSIDSPLQIEVSWDGVVATATATGELDIATAPSLMQRLRQDNSGDESSLMTRTLSRPPAVNHRLGG